MAKVKPSIIEQSGTIGDLVLYKRLGKLYSRRKPTSFTDNKSEAQLRQRALFKAMQHTASILGSAIQRGLAKQAHTHSRVENNEFTSLNKQHFTYDNGTVLIDYPRLVLSAGPIPCVEFLNRKIEGLHVELQFDPVEMVAQANPDDIVFIYAVEFNVEVCQLVASAERKSASVAFNLPDLSAETNGPITFHLYAFVEAANTACISTLSPDEKKSNKTHRNINRRVSPSVFIGTITIES